MQFIPFPQRAMSDIHQHESVTNKNWAVISISALDNFPKIEQTPTCKGLLQLTFADIDVPWLGQHFFSKQQADKILEFAKQMETANVDVMVVHCQAGQSRSPAVCAALAEVYGQKSDLYFRTYVPNMHVYRTLLEAHKGPLV